eukprot:1838629-Prymnesium_polylepis.1
MGCSYSGSPLKIRSRAFSLCTSMNDAHMLYLTPCDSSCAKRRKSSDTICGTIPSSLCGFLPPSAPRSENVLPEPVWP